MIQCLLLVKREFASLFATALAYVYLLFFLLLTALLTFYHGGFYENEHASLQIFFDYHPWVYLLLVPALATRIWSEERRSGSIELLMTLGLRRRTLVLSKFIAFWLLAALALLLTFPMLLTVNFLGEPDNGAIVAGYLGSWLLAGACLALASCCSVLSKNSTTVFLLCLAMCFVFIINGYGPALQLLAQWSPQWLLELFSYASFLARYQALSRGVIDLRDLIFFSSFILAWLAATAILLELKKAEK